MSRKTKTRIPKALMIRVWNTYIGGERGYFACICGKKVYQSAFDCAHVVAEELGGKTTLENLRPLCPPCNKSIGTQNVFRFIRKMGMDPSEFYRGEIPTEEEIGEEMIDETSYKGLQARAMKEGIKANLTKEALEELFRTLDRGDEIDPSFYRKEIREKKELNHMKFTKEEKEESTEIKYIAEELLNRALILSEESKEKEKLYMIDRWTGVIANSPQVALILLFMIHRDKEILKARVNTAKTFTQFLEIISEEIKTGMVYDLTEPIIFPSLEGGIPLKLWQLNLWNLVRVKEEVDGL